jgi:hypothetical protein
MSVQGYRGSIDLDGDALCVKRITANETADDLDTTSTCATLDSNQADPATAYETRLPGVKRLEMTVEADYGAGGAGDPPAVDVGDLTAVLAVVGYLISGNFWVMAFTYALEVKGLISYTMTLKSQGEYGVTIQNTIVFPTP